MKETSEWVTELAHRKSDSRRGNNQHKVPKTVSGTGAKKAGGRAVANLGKVRGDGESRRIL